MQELRGYKKEVYELIREAETLSLKEIRTKMGINYNTIRRTVIGLTKQSLMERVGRGLYKFKC